MEYVAGLPFVSLALIYVPFAEIYPAYDFAHPLCDSLENIT
jgi:hypothetical protein